jgi:hypothetical protein
MLAFDPNTHADHALSPQLRGPMLEARGYWGAQPSPAGLQARWQPEDRTLHITLVDPLSIAHRVVVRARAGHDAFATSTVDAAPEVTVRVAGSAPRVEYAVTAFDAHDNEAFVLGTDEALESAGHDEPAAQSPGARGAILAPSMQDHAPSTGNALAPIGIAAIAVGGAAIIGGVIADVVRENAAAHWNNDALCLPPNGSTRQDNCGSDLGTGQTAGALAIAGLATGGVLAATGVVLWLVASPARPARQASRSTMFRCTRGPGSLGVACGAVF